MTAGDAFGDYKVVRMLGKGGMGEVWLLEGKTGNQVAAKILEASADHESRKRFLREAQLALVVKHPNLVETYDVGEDPDTGLCYILMEYVPGGTLADYIKSNGALAIEDAVAVVEAIASVLSSDVRKESSIVTSSPRTSCSTRKGRRSSRTSASRAPVRRERRRSLRHCGRVRMCSRLH